MVVRELTNSLAVLLVFVLISAPVSASACDLSCWLDRTGSDCHSVSSPDQGHSTSMDSEMNMEPGMYMDMGEDTDAAIVPDHAAMNHTLLKLDFGRNPVEQNAQFVSGSRLPSGNITSCAEEACSNVSVYSSPPDARGLVVHTLCLTAVSLSLHPDLLNSFALTEESETSPPKLLPPDHLVALRI